MCHVRKTRGAASLLLHAGALTQLPIMLDKVHLGEEVDMGQLHMQHGGQGRAQHGDELAWICAVVRIHKMDSRQL